MIKIAVVIPAYKAPDSIADVVSRVPPFVNMIYVIDDACPLGTGKMLEKCSDERLVIIYHEVNQGVGGAVKTGYRHAFSDGADIAVKIDSDGQMDPALIAKFVAPIKLGLADYTKGNRFYNLENVNVMPLARKIGNLGLSFLTKASSGYWTVFDPTNGYTALHRSAYERLQIDKLDNRYFFETDMLFRLNVAGAVIEDIPMSAHYADEKSNLSSFKSLFEFSYKNFITLLKRIMYKYYLRDFNMGSLYLIFGLPLFSFGLIFGIINWIQSIQSTVPATAGTVMTAALPIIIGFQLLIGFLSYEHSTMPRVPLQILKDS